MEPSLAPRLGAVDDAERALTKALRGRKGRLTKADAVAASGLPTHVVNESLERMLRRYRSHLAVTERGELLYEFDPSLQRRDQPTLGERLAEAGHWLARAGMAVFKVAIVVTLIAYLVVFVLLLLAVMFGGGRDRDDRRGGGWGGGGGGGHHHGPGLWWWFLFFPDFGGGRRVNPWGRPYGGAGRQARGKPKKPLLHSVYDFVFGPAKAAEDPHGDNREVLAYLRAHKGRMTATDLAFLFGWSYRKAEEEVTRLMVNYDGEPEITEEGVLVYAFPEKLMKSAEAASSADRERMLGDGSWRFAWDRLEGRPKLSGNTGAMNAMIGGFAGFNFVLSFFGADWAQRSYGLSGPGWDFALTTFPLVFFALFLAIPGVRAIARALGEPARARRNRQRLAMKAVVNARGARLPDGPGMKDLALALEGEPVFDEAGGELRWAFPRVGEELAAFERHLAGVDVEAERQLGPVVFGSDEDVLGDGSGGGGGGGGKPRLPS